MLPPAKDAPTMIPIVEAIDLRVKDIIETVCDGKYRTMIAPEMVVIHRIGPVLNCGDSTCDVCQFPDGNFAVHMCRWFQAHPKVGLTGGENPYHFVITEDAVYQCLCLDECGAHARRWNIKSIGIAVQGDFRYGGPNPFQQSAVRKLSAMLCLQMNKLALFGHTELRDGSKDRSKECPGTRMRMANVREDVRNIFNQLDYLDQDVREGLLTDCGVRID